MRDIGQKARCARTLANTHCFEVRLYSGAVDHTIKPLKI